MEGLQTAWVFGVVFAAIVGGAAGWALHRLGEQVRKQAVEAYCDEAVRVAECARDRAREETIAAEERLAKLREDTSDGTNRVAVIRKRLRTAEEERDRAHVRVAALERDVARLEGEIVRRDRHARAARSGGDGETLRVKTAGNGAPTTATHAAGSGNGGSTTSTHVTASGNGAARTGRPNGNGHGAARAASPPNGRSVSRAGGAPAWVSSPGNGNGKGDDLKAIHGLGPVLERGLHGLGVHSYRQLAQMTPRDAEWLAKRLNVFAKRILREDWASQARREHFRKYNERL